MIENFFAISRKTYANFDLKFYLTETFAKRRQKVQKTRISNSYRTVQSTITKKIFHIVRCFKSDNYFIIRERNILRPQKTLNKQKISLLSLNENSESVRCNFNDSRELIQIQSIKGRKSH